MFLNVPYVPQSVIKFFSHNFFLFTEFIKVTLVSNIVQVSGAPSTTHHLWTVLYFYHPKSSISLHPTVSPWPLPHCCL